jgi:amino-acid N-acetyltransferase
MSAPQIRTATKEDTDSIRVLLEHSGLPTSDLMSSKPQFIVACEGGKILGTGALERFGSSALLRSVAVAPARRGEGLGRAIVEDLERIARAARITRLILLTQTAQPFFEHQGKIFTSLPLASLDRVKLQERLDAIGKTRPEGAA